ncbi:MAG: GDSL-type esterase/lipase family protein [Candidatus Spechtbacterales bacterium]|nr:GDSL-type esterase/lipase family protein [Candidatus Spechtbacterales bacterium]
MTANKIISILVVIIFIAGVIYFISRDNSKVAIPQKEGSIVAFGDSLVAGAGATEGMNWVDILSRDIGEEIINAGVNGDTTQSALARLDRDVLAYDPRIVIVLLGGNDVLRNVAKEQTLNNLKSIITRIQAEGAAVVLVSIPGALLDPYDDDYKDLAQETGAAFVPNVLNNILRDRRLMYDSIHPNDAGNEIMAERIGDKLEDLLE